MRKPTAVVDLDLTHLPPPPADLSTCADAEVLCRLGERPLGIVRSPVRDGSLSLEATIRGVLESLIPSCTVALAERAIASGRPPRWPDGKSLLESAAEPPTSGPLVTVAVCTRDRVADLKSCLDALVQQRYDALDLLVIDNAPASDATERLVRDVFPSVRYVREPRPGLDWARNRAILEARGDIVAFTDDDTRADRYWVSSLVRLFLAAPDVMAVTGLVIPAELETDAQRLFEQYGGFGRGFRRRWYRAPLDRPAFPRFGGTGAFGTGANMAFWRRVFDDVGGFDPALDVGTCTNGGGDLDMFFRVLKAGHTLVYEPSAIVRHCHRRSYASLRNQIANNGVGFYSYLTRTAAHFKDERPAAARFAVWWFSWWTLRRLASGLQRKLRLPLDLVLAEAAGSLTGLFRYSRSVREAQAVAARFPDEPTLNAAPATPPKRTLLPEARRHVDLAEPLRAIADVTNYDRLRVVVSWHDNALGSIAIDHHGSVVSALWLSDEIAQQLTTPVLDAHTRMGAAPVWAAVTAGLAGAMLPAVERARSVERQQKSAPPPPSASIVVATCDRPADLARCLTSLVAQRTRHPFEIVVVDNHPASGVTPGVLRAFPDVRLVQESRPGLSFARNAGILAATGDVVVSTDDDVVASKAWLDRLLEPFAQPNVMIVCGNVLPLETEHEAQRLFEAYGGLGRGFTRQFVDGDWFKQWRRAVPTWELGCTANAAFRADIFRRPEIGLMDEALGAGTPAGCSEDTYVFYRTLKAGHTIAYEPDAIVWHRHRDSMRALRRQIYSYAKGHVAYQLTTWLDDGDWRAWVRLGYELPRIYTRRAWEWARGTSDYPLSLVGLEVLGTLAGPYAWWRSRRRAQRLGRTPLAGAASVSKREPDSVTQAA
jgi:GT2 family glycosyltransferase